MSKIYAGAGADQMYIIKYQLDSVELNLGTSSDQDIIAFTGFL